MAKAPNSVIGLDLGRHTMKAVLLKKGGGGRPILTHYAVKSFDPPGESADALGKQVKTVLKELGGSAKFGAVAVSHASSLIRIIDQPDTPVNLLREGLRINGMALLNQDCRDLVLDCDKVGTSTHVAENSSVAWWRYLVGGLPRTLLGTIAEAVEGFGGLEIGTVQLAPICAYNAFEFAHEEIFQTRAYFLVDFGNTSATVMVGNKRELSLVRTIDFGGKSFLDAVASMSSEPRAAVLDALEHEDEIMGEYARVALNQFAREIQSSIGFFEHRSEQTVSRIYFSGGLSKLALVLKLLGEELSLPCESWNVLSQCETALPPARAAALEKSALDLNVAFGAAVELLQAS